jgi:anti-anti-sigma factor
MSVQIKSENNQLTCTFDKHMDTIFSQNAEEEIIPYIDTVDKIVFDLKYTEYISSVFLRLVMTIAKHKGKNKLSIVNASSKNIQNIFKISGFSSILDISN